MLDTADATDVADPAAPGFEDSEVQLDPGALFFSRTDARGVIEAGNSTFQSVSGYDWAELLGAPHKRVRHPGMPKAIFHIMWDGLQNKGAPVVAYVKNRTKDGRFYWVLAFASPLEGGYLSVRIKPQSDLFKTITGEYASLRAREEAGGLSADDSAADFLTRLEAHGFADYTEFSAAAAAQELLCLGQSQDWVRPEKVQQLRDVAAALKDVRARCQSIAKACDAIELLPTNLEIQSARLGRLAAPIAIIARDSKERTRSLRQKMTDFALEMDRAAASVNSAMVEVCVSQVQEEMRRAFVADGARAEGQREIDFDHEASVLAKLDRANHDDHVARLNDALGQVLACSVTLATILREVTGINVTRTMCSIENSSLNQNGGTIQMIIEELTRFQADIPKALRSIKGLFDVMKRDLERVLTP